MITPIPFVLYRYDEHGPRKIWTKKSYSTNLVLKVVNIEEGIENEVDYFEFIKKQAQVAKPRHQRCLYITT